MKKATSRASRMSVDVQDYIEDFNPGIPDAKWQEILEKEDTDSFILGVREEIFYKCMEICFEKYLERQAVSFTVHCAYLAWCKVLNIYHMFRDPGDTDDPQVRESWEPDAEPQPSVPDSWASECIKTDEPCIHVVEKKPVKEAGSPDTSLSIIYQESSVESSSFISEIFDIGEGDYFYPQENFVSTTSSVVSRKKSLFTKTLSMSRESLPLIDPLAYLQDQCKELVLNKTKFGDNNTK